MIPHKAFYFIRHGETEWNRKKIYMGTRDIPLNDAGVKQAQEAALLLKHKKISHIVSSPLSRAIQTAEILAKIINKPITIVENLKERHLGCEEGKDVDKTILIEQLIKTTSKDEEEASIFQKRVVSSINNALRSFYDAPLIVSHGGVYATLCDAMKWPISDIHNCAAIYHIPPKMNQHSWLISPLKN